MKERITVTLEKNLIRHLDSFVDGTRYKNRSHVIESVLMDKFQLNRPSCAIILAGGKGTRLRPITEEIPKPMLPIHGKPIVEHLIEFFKVNGIPKIFLSVGFKKEIIKDYFLNGKQIGVDIEYIEENKPLGTAGPLKKIEKQLTNTFVVSNGDELKDFDLSEMFLFHKRNKALATLALVHVDNPWEYGAVKLQGNKIVEFLEKSKKLKSGSLINAGLYMMEPEILKYIPKGKKVMFEKDVFPKLAKQGKLFGYPFVGQWFDTGTFERYERAIKQWRGIHGRV